MRALIVGWLAAAWHSWITAIPFPYGGGEAHWVIRQMGTLGFVDGLFVGSLSLVAGVGFTFVLRARRLLVVLLASLAAPALVAGAPGVLHGSIPDLILRIWVFGLPTVAIGLAVRLSRVKLGWLGIGVVAWWPGLFQLSHYLRWTELPEAFRGGVGIMLIVGGLLVGAVARSRENRTPDCWKQIEWP